jgi:hypothetical protein
VIHQSFPTNLAKGVKHFEVGGDHMFVVSNILGHTVELYRWDGYIFVRVQIIEMSKPCGVAAWNMDGVQYIGVASSSTDDTAVKIYNWNGSALVHSQDLKYPGCDQVYVFAVEPFEISGINYLGVPVVRTLINGELADVANSKIFQWDGSTYVRIQDIETSVSKHMKHFVIDGMHFLGVSNSFCHRNCGAWPYFLPVDNTIYKWSGSTFVEFQIFTREAAWQWSSFDMNGQFFLTLEYHGGCDVFTWSGTTFVTHQTVTGTWGGKPFKVLGVPFLALTPLPYNSQTLVYRMGVTVAPTPSPTPVHVPQATPPPAGGAGSGASAVGDPHLQNIHGERFDLMKAGKHVLINIPRGTSAEAAFLRVQADARRLGGQCADMYFQQLNVTGSWAEAKQAGGLHYSVSQHDAKIPEWVAFSKVELKVVHGRTDSGLLYLNLYVKHLGRAGFAVGGLLGEDDHEDVSTPPVSCAQRMALVDGSQSERSPSVVSVAVASFE